MNGLDLTSRAGLAAGTSKGPVIDSTNPTASRLLQVLRYNTAVKMPPTGRLTEAEIRSFETWVAGGAEWPDHLTKPLPAGDNPLWAFEPVRRPLVPAVANAQWVRQPVDAFLLAEMEKHGLQPNAPADPLTLLRRVTYDLTGLPPTLAEIREFLNDPSDEGYNRVIERLLGSPRYAERWGRHWLDVARYADSTGADEDVKYPYAWRYRDYVIQSFQNDLPYDQFIREQLAGDLYAPGDNRSLIATGFLAVGPKLLAEVDKRKMLYDILDEQVETTGKAFLGLTIQCARCHDHKFDPISTKDYYALAGIFASTRQLGDLRPAMSAVSEIYFPPLLAPADAMKYEAHAKRLKAAKRKISDIQQEAGEYYLESVLDTLPRYMMATLGKDTPTGLDSSILDKWSEYLRPTSDRRPYLEPWQSNPSAATAEQYLRQFRATFESRRATMASWRRAGSPEEKRPFFFTGENRFYTEVTAAKGPFAPPATGWEKHLPEEAVARLAAAHQDLKAIEATAPPQPEFACGIVDGERVRQRVFVRGNPQSLGDETPPAVPVVLAKNGQPRFGVGSGRKELAAWIADAKNPLTARVFVNRVWAWHFGEGLVRTPGNFGVMGERPTHPALLDYLASEFTVGGWSLKRLHRIILNSAAYRMSSDIPASKAEADPANLRLSRFNRRRLSVEEMRDSLLTLEGKLDLSMGGTLQHGSGGERSTMSLARLGLDPDESYRRTVYLPIRRSNVPAMFTLFDFGDASTSSDGRSRTNIAPQALFAMNSEFMTRATTGWSSHLLSAATDDRERVRLAWREGLAREPSPSELQQALTYLASFPGSGGEPAKWRSYCRALLASNLFMYIR